jgi:hypothetical protein
MTKGRTNRLTFGAKNASGVDMDSHQDMSGNDTENVVGETESMAEPMDAMNEETQESAGQDNKGDPLYVQKRLKQQRRAHDREIRELHSRMEHMQSQLQPNQSYQPQQNPHEAPQGGGMDDAIHKAVSYALQQKEMEERRARDHQAQQHIAKQYGELNRHLDATADKYDDFDDLVRGDATPFTAHMRDAALMLPKKGSGSAGEVLYKLGKNPEELARIAKLPAIDQASEMVALSHALISGGENKQSHSRPLGQIKSNPVVNSVGVTDKTPVSDIRERMKKGIFK